MAPTLLPASRAHGRCSAKVEAAHSGGREQADVQRNHQAELTHTRARANTHTHAHWDFRGSAKAFLPERLHVPTREVTSSPRTLVSLEEPGGPSSQLATTAASQATVQSPAGPRGSTQTGGQNGPHLPTPPRTNGRRSRSEAKPRGRRHLLIVLTQVLHLQTQPARPRIKNI